MDSFPTAATLLEVAAGVLAGELAFARGEFEEGIARLEAAVAIQDDLPYNEPPPWFYPVRQNLGAALLAASRAADGDVTLGARQRAQQYAAEAEAVYREDLRRYPQNGWSLFGLAQSLRVQGKDAEAADVQRRFAEAWQRADVALTASRF